MDVARLRIDTSGLAERADGDGVVRLGEGEDGDINPLARTSLRPTGRVLRLGVDDERSAVALARLTPPVLDWLAASEATWADDARLSEIAEILDADDDIYAASINVAADASVEVALDGAGPPAIAFGVAYAGVGDTQRTSFVYLFADEDDAAAAFAEFAGPLELEGAGSNSGWTFRSDTVELEGRAIVARGAFR